MASSWGGSWPGRTPRSPRRRSPRWSNGMGRWSCAVCRGILGDSHDAHDAFQATFLLLVRKAGSIRSRESVGEWLFRIARRVAVRARVDAVRRRQRLEVLMAERRNSLADAGAISHDAEPDHDSLIAEVDRLPERYRAAVVLHYFEGLSTEATARRLGCARGTVLSRLSRARERLRSRLERRGVSLEAVWPVGAAADRLAWTGTVPSQLVHNTIRAAASMALGGAAIESVVPAAVAALARGVARTLVVLPRPDGRLSHHPGGVGRLDRTGGVAPTRG